jgi:hypothetical protein
MASMWNESITTMQAFCDIMLCHWVSSSPGFEGLWCLKTLGTAYTVTQHNILEGLNVHHHSREKIETHKNNYNKSHRDAPLLKFIG